MSELVKIGDKYYKETTEQIKPEESKNAKEYVFKDDYIPKSQHEELNEKYETEKSKSGTLEKQAIETKKMLENSGDYKSKYEELNGKYDTDLQAKDAAIKNIEKKYLIQNKLAESGVKHSKLLMNEIDFEKISIENGNLLGFDPILEGLKTSYKDFFPEQQMSNNNSNNDNQNTLNNHNSTNNTNNKDFEDETYWDKEFEKYLE